MYPFLTMNDHTEIVYSHLLDGGRVKIYVEKPDEQDGFHHAVCFLPGCRWEDILLLRGVIRNTNALAPLIKKLMLMLISM